MHHFPGFKKESDPEPGEEIAPQIAEARMLDRADQRWTNVIGALFSVVSFLCLTGLGVLGLFFVMIVAEDGEIGMLPIFIGLGLSFVLGMLLLDVTHARALAGYRDARERNARFSRAVTSGLLCLLLGMIHPAMALAIPLSAGLGILGHAVLGRLSRDEPLWDFLPSEAIAILAGRDRIGAQMAATRPREHALAEPVTRAGTALSVVAALASGSYLVAENIMTMAAFVPLVLGSLWASQAILDYAEDRFARRDTELIPVAQVERIEAGADQDENIGLDIQGLSIRKPDGRPVLTDISLHVGPGQITGIIGASGAGKSLLLQAVADPFCLTDLEVTGRVCIGRTDLWARQSAEQSVPVVFLPPEPVLLPASGAKNLSCFHDGDMLARGRWFLERLVFAVDMVEEICQAQNAQTLPSMQRKSLALARSFLLGPPLYLMDRPEDGLPEKQLSALTHRLSQETRMGRSVLMITNNRMLLESCDRLIVMQAGRIVDYGPASEVRGRLDTGWTRFLGTRQSETEEVLVNWVRSHFYRDGDEANRRKVAGVASDLLAYSCQNADARHPGQVSFTFKHFDGHCILRMQDGEPPVGTSAFQRALSDAAGATETHKLPLLASVVRAAIEVECGSKQDERQITAKIATYDPRRTAQSAGAEDANQTF